MPQLDPAPWLMILVFTWLAFATLIAPKTLSLTFPNAPTPQQIALNKLPSWTWQWY